MDDDLIGTELRHSQLVVFGAPARSHHQQFGKFAIISDGAATS
jgi:hypothetical protein